MNRRSRIAGAVAVAGAAVFSTGVSMLIGVTAHADAAQLSLSIAGNAATVSTDGKSLTFPAQPAAGSAFTIAHDLTVSNAGSLAGVGTIAVTDGSRTVTELAHVMTVKVVETSPVLTTLINGPLADAGTAVVTVPAHDAVTMRMEFILNCQPVGTARCPNVSGQTVRPVLSLPVQANAPVVPSVSPTAAPTTPAASPSPSTSPSPSPSVSPTPTPSVSPTPVPTPSPTFAPLPTPKLLAKDIGYQWSLSVPDPTQVSHDLKTILANALIAAGMIMMIMFPAELFNGTLKENYEEVSGWFAPVLGLFAGLRRGWAGLKIPKLLSGFLFTAMVGLAYSLVAPDWGFHADALRMTIALGTGLGVTTLAANYAALVYTRRRLGEQAEMKLRWGALPFALVCVAIARRLNFEPGYIYGLVAGFEAQRELRKHQLGKAVLAWAMVGIVIVGVAWGLIIPLKDWVESSHHAFWPLVFEETSTAITVEGLTALALGLMPLRFLEGDSLFQWRKSAWAAVYLVVGFAFLHIVVHPEFAGRDASSPVAVWLSMFLGFGLFSLAFWAYFRFRPARPPHEPAMAEA